MFHRSNIVRTAVSTELMEVVQCIQSCVKREATRAAVGTGPVRGSTKC